MSVPTTFNVLTLDYLKFSFDLIILEQPYQWGEIPQRMGHPRFASTQPSPIGQNRLVPKALGKKTAKMILSPKSGRDLVCEASAILLSILRNSENRA